jgi:ABC-type taurine transport system substrate-binding protein
MINKGKVRTDERMYCEECYQKSKNPFKSSAGDSMNERDGGETVDYLKKMFGMED